MKRIRGVAFFFSLLAGAHAVQAETVSADDADRVHGSWTGTYFCAQGLTNFNLVFDETGSDRLSATFNFYRHETNRDVPVGSFVMRGSFSRSERKVVLYGKRWLVRPQGYGMIDFAGTIDEKSTTLSGAVRGTDCTTFSAVRDHR